MTKVKKSGDLGPRSFIGFGLQSGGSTFISYCFLQRPDMAGVLDNFHDRMPDIPEPDLKVNWWCKCTIASFRAKETLEYFADFGVQTCPFLIVRDVRFALDSLLTRDYGRNSTTAADPPLRLRCRRFLADWEYFMESGFPVVRFEDFVAEPRSTLIDLCNSLELTWSEDMVSWPKNRRDVWDGKGGNQRFVDGLSENLSATMLRKVANRDIRNLPLGDLEWMERVFQEYNREHGYPLELDASSRTRLVDGWMEPSINNARNYRGMKLRQDFYHLIPGLRRLKRRAATHFVKK